MDLSGLNIFLCLRAVRGAALHFRTLSITFAFYAFQTFKTFSLTLNVLVVYIPFINYVDGGERKRIKFIFVLCPEKVLVDGDHLTTS